MTYKIKILRYLLVFVGLTIGIPVLFAVLKSLFGLDLGSGGASIIPVMIAAMVEGQGFAKIEKRRPENKEAWNISLRLAGLGLIPTFIISAIFFAATPSLHVYATNLLFTIGLIAIVGAVFVLLSRIFFSLGAKGVVRASEKARK